MLTYLREDLRRLGGPWRQAKQLAVDPVVWSTVAYRLRESLRDAARQGVADLPLSAASELLHSAAKLLASVDIAKSAKIGPGLYLAHVGHVVIGAGTVIGHHCTIAHGVTIGHAGGGVHQCQQSPVIGDRVYIGPGAIVLGEIVVGSDALIAPGSVVTHSIPPRGVVAGNPARLLSLAGSFGLIRYPGMECDVDRNEALRDTK